MRKITKWILAILGAVTIVVIILVVAGYAYVSRTLPRDNGTAHISGLGEDVRIVRDRESVPHIIGQSIIDVVAAQGYVHAQDRLWQMEMLRMAGQGRLSEMLGEKTVGTDIYLRTLNLAGHSRESYKLLQPQTRELLQAYTRGINAYINRDTRLYEPPLGSEFIILNHLPEPWEPWQSLMSLKVMALTLGSNMSSEIKRLALASKGFNSNEIDDLVSYNLRDVPPPLPDLRKIYGFRPSGKSTSNDLNSEPATKVAGREYFDLVWPTGITASNNWVISGSRTKSGKVLLANDPHLGLTAPSIWYLSHLSWVKEGQRHNIIGASLPSIPLILLGRSDRTAWGFTTSNLDSQDIYLERINPENDNEYLTDEGWKKFDTREEIIKVSGLPDINHVVRLTRHGPVLPDGFRNIKKYLPVNHVASLKWLALSNDDTSIDAMTRMADAKNVNGFIETMKSLLSPMQSIVVGDSDGDIGFIAPARVAIRSTDNKIMGRAPVPGWLPKYEWQGFLEFDQLPRYKNPANGVLYSANSKFVDQTYNQHITWDWAEDYRHQRIKRLIADRKSPHDMASMMAGHRDDYSPALVEFRNDAIGRLQAGVSINRNIISAIKNWDGRMKRDSNIPLIMMAWFKTLSEDLLKDDLGDEYSLFARGNISVILDILRSGGARDWCDDRNRKGRQSCSKIVFESFKTSLAKLRVDFGDDWKSWQWGQAHIAYGEHRPFANVPPLDKLFNVEVESAGGPYTLLRGQTDFGKKNPFYNRHSSSYRAIYDFADLNNSRYIQTTGQSGNFLSPFYRNFAKRWADGEYIKISSDAEIYEKDAVGVWKAKRKPGGKK
jgi:penicillin amidase